MLGTLRRRIKISKTKLGYSYEWSVDCEGANLEELMSISDELQQALEARYDATEGTKEAK
jgi:hypothetical protein